MRQYPFAPSVLHGVEVTVELAVVPMLIGIVVGVLLAVMRLSDNRVLSVVAWGYIWLSAAHRLRSSSGAFSEAAASVARARGWVILATGV